MIKTSFHDVNNAKRVLRIGLSVYFILLIFEGALRKWVLPEFSTPLLLVRDPIAVFILFTAWRNGFFIWNNYLFVIIFISIISFFSTILLGHGNLLVALYGIRIYLLQLPLIFVIENIFDRNQVMHFVKWMIVLSIPMLFLIVWQFYSPQSAWVNRGVGGDDAGAGFTGALGYYRPPGTFSFTNGLSTFFALASPLSLYALIKPTGLKRWLELLAFCCVLLSIPFSISRSLYFQSVITFIFLMVATVRNTKLFLYQIFAIIFVISLYLFTNLNSDLSTGIKVFKTRFENANESEGGVKGLLLDRFVGGSIEALTSSSQIAFFGAGVGLGTNVGSQLSIGSRKFIISEGEWGRIIGEMGLLIGFILIGLRVMISFKLLSNAYRQLSTDNILPWLLSSSVVLLFAQGQWGQPTAMGFSVFFTGLALAALKES
jgi:hypothetical protein